MDDTLDAFGLHGMGGIGGAIFTGIFALDGGLIYTGSFVAWLRAKSQVHPALLPDARVVCSRLKRHKMGVLGLLFKTMKVEV